MPIDEKEWEVLMGALDTDTVTDTVPGTDPEALAALRDALDTCLDAVVAEIREQETTA